MNNVKKETLEMKGTTYINTKKLALAAFFAAVAVVGSTFSIPVFGAKCSPVQHLINVLCAIFLGPGYGVLAAFVASLIRNLMGLGSFLAFPGSMCGAFLSGIMYKSLRKLPAAYIGEVFGTGIIGGILSYPVAAFIMGNSSAGVFTFVIPFLISTIGGTILAIVITMALRQLNLIDRIRENLV
ncbi:energy coupling factor transporter S component ThiW [Oribacterium sp. P6A1]|uniref:energy coupling factor transporter S component ThiW n=1 Tax=Oribacterium sp. P6A1 TaxID=1410612 RepID=UPI000AF5625C|nr:energy coupling factor transporter S component ThiW [Oribacterium sp. P6A1]